MAGRINEFLSRQGTPQRIYVAMYIANYRKHLTPVSLSERNTGAEYSTGGATTAGDIA